MRVVMIGWCSEGRSLNLPHMVVIARGVYDCDNLCCILSFLCVLVSVSKCFMALCICDAHMTTPSSLCLA